MPVLLAFYAAQPGITPTRLNRVCREVLSVKEIGLTPGFEDVAYFTRFFARQTGTSPSRFRAAARRELAGRRPAPSS
ncbi:helix-turn-helix domain-containing protein [Aquabacterium sp. A7-Y]|uniref:helix-turn-helix domain-containing protein n=1 Tax=Aquabacterium sp. A7-Y TaxID=1349605 RepID=UPI00223DFC37|nr:helix-turn-helix domain-containing protein [Aquabacterium sp. A7-Y]MCW7539123.1 helix-turn-helix domain-containing protein [Aquabacterium sp. A7-Y]